MAYNERYSLYTFRYRSASLNPGESPESYGWIGGSGLIQDIDQSTFTPNLPDWKWRLMNHVNASTSMSAYGGERITKGDAYIFIKNMRSGQPLNLVFAEYQGDLAFPSINPPGVPSSFSEPVLNQTKMAILRKIDQANNSLKGLVSLGEFGETARLVNGAGKQLLSGMHSYLDDVNQLVRKSHPRQLLRDIGGKWLEYSFGWKPLISDIDDGLNGLHRFRSQRPPRILVRASGRDEEVIPLPPETGPFYGVLSTRSFNTRAIYGCRIYGSVGTNLSPLRFSHEFGFTPQEFIPTVWELIPYSFLVDYFVNIGAVISASSTNTNFVQWLGIGQLREIFMEVSLSAVPSPPDGWEVVEKSISLGTPYRYRSWVKERGPLDLGSLAPSLVFTIPGLGTKWINMSALASQHLDTSRNVRRALRL